MLTKFIKLLHNIHWLSCEVIFFLRRHLYLAWKQVSVSKEAEGNSSIITEGQERRTEQLHQGCTADPELAGTHGYT